MAEARNESQDGGGIPVNVNPFVVNDDWCIYDGVLENVAPQYFRNDRAPLDVNPLLMSQAEAEKLVRELFETDVLDGKSFAVKEPYAYIIPADLRNKVRVSRVLGETCREKDTYLLES